AVADMAAAMTFYRLAGLEVPADAAEHSHVELDVDGVELAFSTADVITKYDPAWRGLAPSTAAVLQLRLRSSAAVDEMYDALTAAGYRGHLAPFDAFWGSRYCEVDDADGHTVGFHGAGDGPPT